MGDVELIQNEDGSWSLIVRGKLAERLQKLAEKLGVDPVTLANDAIAAFLGEGRYS